MKKTGTWDALGIALWLGTAGLTAAVYGRLPDRVPTHFDARGVANGWMDRPYGAWFLPLGALVSWIVLRYGAVALPGAWRTRMERSPVALVAAMMVALLCALQAVVLYAAIKAPPSVGGLTGPLLAFFWIALGLAIPRVRRNPWIGVRTPWTLSSDENWARTHRFAGYCLCVGGLMSLVASLAQAPHLALGAIIGSALMPAIYSFVVARQLG